MAKVWLTGHVVQLHEGLWCASLDEEDGPCVLNVYGATEEIAKANLLKVLSVGKDKAKVYADGTGKEYRQYQRKQREREKQQEQEWREQRAKMTLEERFGHLRKRKETA